MNRRVIVLSTLAAAHKKEYKLELQGQGYKELETEAGELTFG